MAEDVTVSFGADDSALSQAIAKIKASMTELDAKAVALGKTISEAFAKMGITQAAGFKLAGPEEQNALAQYWASMEKGEVATKKLTASTKELGQASRQTGIDFGSMAERMAARMVLFEAVRLAIQGIKYAFDLISNLQQARIEFDATSSSVEELGTNFKSLQLEQKAALEPDIGKMVQIKNALEDFGMSERKAILLTQDLSQWSKILGVDANKLAEALGRVSQGEGSLQDMRLVTHMMGEQSEEGRQLIQTIVDATKALKNFEMEQATAEKSMEAVIRATERMGEKVERSRTRGQEFLKETGNLEDVQAQLPKLAARPELAGLPIETLIGSGALRLPQMSPQTSQIVRNQVKDYVSEYRRGLAQIQQEEGLSPEAMRKLAPTLSTDYVMRAAQQAREDEKRERREEEEDRRAGIQREKEAREAEIAGAKAEFAKVGPQAVTAPPTELWTQFTNSLKGIGLLTNEQFTTGITQLVTELGKVTTAADGTKIAVGDLQLLFTSG